MSLSRMNPLTTSRGLAVSHTRVVNDIAMGEMKHQFAMPRRFSLFSQHPQHQSLPTGRSLVQHKPSKAFLKLQCLGEDVPGVSQALCFEIQEDLNGGHNLMESHYVGIVLPQNLYETYARQGFGLHRTYGKHLDVVHLAPQLFVMFAVDCFLVLWTFAMQGLSVTVSYNKTYI